jgi:hypothetical protein
VQPIPSPIPKAWRLSPTTAHRALVLLLIVYLVYVPDICTVEDDPSFNGAADLGMLGRLALLQHRCRGPISRPPELAVARESYLRSEAVHGSVCSQSRWMTRSCAHASTYLGSCFTIYILNKAKYLAVGYAEPDISRGEHGTWIRTSVTADRPAIFEHEVRIRCMLQRPSQSHPRGRLYWSRVRYQGPSDAFQLHFASLQGLSDSHPMASGDTERRKVDTIAKSY